MTTPGLPLLHAAATLAMCGVVWFVQIVHYPLFARVGRDAFPEYEREHIRRTGWIVGPLMILEGTTAALLALTPPAESGSTLPRIGLVLLLLIWSCTAWLQVPQHRRLETGFSRSVHRRLVAGNWIRTTLWTARAGIALWTLPGGPP